MKTKHWLAFIFLGSIWGSSFMWIKIGLQEISPTMLVAFRVLFGFLFCVIIILFQLNKLKVDSKTWFHLLMLGITNQVIPFYLIAWGEQSIDSSVAAILDSTVPLFTVVIAHFFLKDDKMSMVKVLGLLIGFAGVVILFSKGLLISTSSFLGQAAVIIASLFYAISGIYIRRTTQNVNGFIRSGIPLLSASFIMWPTVFLTESPVEFPTLGMTWTALLFLGTIGSGLAFVLAYYLIHEIGPTRMSMVTYLFPLVGIILGITFLNEQLTWQIVTGGVLIILSLVVTNMRSTKSLISTELKAET